MADRVMSAGIMSDPAMARAGGSRFLVDAMNRLGRAALCRPWKVEVYMDTDFYDLQVAGLNRRLPKIPIGGGVTIASFVLLGDAELTEKAAQALDAKIPEVEVFVTAEAKGIPLAYALARLRGQAKYVVARKSIKTYMADSLESSVKSITTAQPQTLYLDGRDAGFIRGKEVCLIDDVISTGASLQALEELVLAAGAQVACRAAILAEGEAQDRDDIVYLEPLPLF